MSTLQESKVSDSSNGDAANGDDALPLIYLKPDALDDTEEGLEYGHRPDGTRLEISPPPSFGLTTAAELQLYPDGPPSRTSTWSGSSLQSPFVGKAIPADPFTTKHDASSFSALEQTRLNLEASLNRAASSEESGSDSASSRPKSTLESLREFQRPLDPAFEAIPSVDSPSLPIAESPSVITYRKSRRSSSISSLPSSSTTVKRAPSFDSNAYIDKYYKNTRYRYPTTKRNIEFHNLFRPLDLTENLLDDFSCAVSREILLQGRLYVSERRLSFNSNLLGWVTNFSINIADIVSIQKKSTAGLFPNAIMIQTKDTKHTFASFVSRDLTFEFIRTVWEVADPSPTPSADSVRSSSEEPRESLDRAEKSQIESYINTVDGDTPRQDWRHLLSSSLEESDVSLESDAESNTNNGSIESVNSFRRSIDQESTKIRKFNPDSNYINEGPDTHLPTTAVIELHDNEIELCDEIVDAPLGVVYGILFGASNTKFHRLFVEAHDGSEISEYGEYHAMESDPEILERKFTYRRALNFPLGPKSTLCLVTEVIRHRDFDGYILILTTTTTPDVPLGNVFAVKTCYLLDWSQHSKTRLRMSFYIDWLGRSWLKSVIEKGTLSGQQAATKDLLEALTKELESVTYYSDVDNDKINNENNTKNISAFTTRKKIKPPKDPNVAVKTGSTTLETTASTVPSRVTGFSRAIIALTSLMGIMIIFLQWRILASSHLAIRKLDEDLALHSQLLAALQK